jgi:hypothetical protein
MAISFEWNVSDCEVYPNKDGLSDVVHKVHYKLKGVDDPIKIQMVKIILQYQ